MFKIVKVVGWSAVAITIVGCFLTGVVFAALRQDCQGGGIMTDKQQRELRAVTVILLVVLVVIAAGIAAIICLPDQWPTKPQPQPLVTG